MPAGSSIGPEAVTVKHIYERYLELGSVRLLRNDLKRREIVSKVRVSKNGVRSGGRQVSRGALYELLSNPIYLGEIRHKKERHPGQHQPTVSRELWEKVQLRLRDQAATHRERPTKAPPSSLAGKLFDENGEPLACAGRGKGDAPLSLLRLAWIGQEGRYKMTGAGGAYLHRSLNRPFAPRLSRFSVIERQSPERSRSLNIDANRLPSIFKVAEAWDSKSAIRSGSCISTVSRLIERVWTWARRTASRFLSNCRSRPMKGVMSRLRTNSLR